MNGATKSFSSPVLQASGDTSRGSVLSPTISLNYRFPVTLEVLSQQEVISSGGRKFRIVMEKTESK